MKILLGLLPFIALFAGIATLGPALGRGSNSLGALRMAVVWGMVAVLGTELLSLASLVTVEGLAAFWILLVALAGICGLQLRARGAWKLEFESAKARLFGELWPLTLACGVVLATTAIVAWLAPPSTWDSLNYHLPRIAHWAQLGAVRHYATGIEIQNNMPPAAEILTLQSYVLSGGDRWVNFVGWLAVFGSALGTSALARYLGANRWGQVASFAFAVTLPMAVIQASSTTTDSVVAFWTVCAAVEVIRLRDAQENEGWGQWFLGGAVGLAILTKPTALAYLIPLAGLTALYLIRAASWRRIAQATAIVTAAVLIINAGHWYRNYRTYRNPIAPQSRIDDHRATFLGGKGFVSNMIRNVDLHLGTPSPHVNKGLALVTQAVHGLLGLDVNDPRNTATGRFKVQEPTTNEDRAGNPQHTYLLLGLAVVLMSHRREVPGVVVQYGLTVLLAVVAFSALFKWQLFGSRYHLPFFILIAPVAGWTIQTFVGVSWGRVLVGALLIASLPWLLAIKSRPLIALRSSAYVDSILTTPRQHLYFANGLHLEEPYTSMVEQVIRNECTKVGLSLLGGQAEYPLWVLLDASQPDMTIRWMVEGTASAAYRDRSYQPCAVICEGCEDQGSWGKLPIVYSRSPFRLYMAAP